MALHYWYWTTPTSHKMTSSCLRPFPPLTFAGATDGTVNSYTHDKTDRTTISENVMLLFMCLVSVLNEKTTRVNQINQWQRVPLLEFVNFWHLHLNFEV